jgi:hypothetical protein
MWRKNPDAMHHKRDARLIVAILSDGVTVGPDDKSLVHTPLRIHP